MKANTFFINVVPPFKIFQTLGVNPTSLGRKHTPFFFLVKINLPNISLKKLWHTSCQMGRRFRDGGLYNQQS
jgi:hypothetical protein